MIRIHCVNCKTLLEIDDGFAGGVCRCVHCGKMQAVPKASRSTARQAGPDLGLSGSKPIQEKAGSGSRILSPSSVAGSGLGSDNLRAAPLAGKIAAPLAKSNLRILLLGFAAVILLLIGLIVWLMSGGNGETATSTNASSPAGTDVAVNSMKQPPSVKTPDLPPEYASGFAPPSFGGLSLPEPSVIYLIDRSGLAEDAVSVVKQAVLKSIDSLHTDQQFQIIVWRSEGGEAEGPIPEGGLARATPDALASATAELTGEGLGPKITEREEPPKNFAIAQPDFSGAGFAPKLDFSDNAGPPGQTLTPKSNMVLRSITVKGYANTPQSFGLGSLGRSTVTISRVDAGDALTQLTQESAPGGFTNGGAYETFLLSKPVPLIAGTQYAFAVFTENGFYGFAKSAGDVYDGGSAIQHGAIARRAADGAKIVGPQPVDRTFYINGTNSSTDGKSAIEIAVAQNPAVVLLIGGKTYEEAFAAHLLEARNASAVKFDVIRVGDVKSPSEMMRKIAERTGGQFRDVELEALRPRRN